jgi:hypothetical protein
MPPWVADLLRRDGDPHHRDVPGMCLRDVRLELTLRQRHGDDRVGIRVEGCLECSDVTLDRRLAVKIGRLPAERLRGMDGSVGEVAAGRRDRRARDHDDLLARRRLGRLRRTGPPRDFDHVGHVELQLGLGGIFRSHEARHSGGDHALRLCDESVARGLCLRRRSERLNRKRHDDRDRQGRRDQQVEAEAARAPRIETAPALAQSHYSLTLLERPRTHRNRLVAGCAAIACPASRASVRMSPPFLAQRHHDRL